MAISYLNSINLNGNEIQNFVVQPLAGEPSSLISVGRKFFNTLEGREAIYTGSAWKLAAYMSDINLLKQETKGINDRLVSIESYFSSSADADSLINKWNEIVEFLNATEGTTLESILSSYATKATVIEAGAGLVGSLRLDGSSTFSLPAVGNVGSYYKVTTDTYGRVVSGVTSLAISDVTDLKKNLDRITPIENWYTKLKDLLYEQDGNVRISASLLVDKDIADGGESGGSGTTLSSLLKSWSDYNAETMGGYALSAGLGHELHERVSELEQQTTQVSVSNLLTSGNAIATITIDDQSYIIKTPDFPTSLKNPYSLTIGNKSYDGSSSVSITPEDIGALTVHQAIYGLTIKDSAGTSQLSYTPNVKSAELTLTKAMVGLGNVENVAISSWAGSNKITTVGTITTGTWNGTKITNNYLVNNSMTIAGKNVQLGGSISASEFITALNLDKVTKKYAGSITRAYNTTSYTITHGLNTNDVVVLVYDPSSLEQVMVDVKMATVNTVEIQFAKEPEQNYRVVVVG